MELNQLRVYRNGMHYANVPENRIFFGVTGVPRLAIHLMEQFAKGDTAITRYEIWSWEWQTLPKR